MARTKNWGLYGKLGRPPKEWKPPEILQMKVKKGNFKVIFDDSKENLIFTDLHTLLTKTYSVIKH
jgi:hypothetical protein